MLDTLKRFWTEEDGMTVVEIVVVIAVLVAVALIFREGIMRFINQLMNRFFTDPGDMTGQRDTNVNF